MMKKWITAGLILLALSVFAPIALAEEVKVGVTAAPEELADSGTVQFTFTISNYSEYELSDILIHYNGTDYDPFPDGVIPVNGEVRGVVLELPVSGSQLDSPIEFIASGIRNGETVTANTEITIRRAADPSLLVTRTADRTSGRQGDTVKLTYTVKNETKFDMNDIVVIDEDISDDPILKVDTLIAGSSYGIDHVYTIGDRSVTSSPFATYTVNGKMKSFSAIEPTEITMILMKLNMAIRQGTPNANGTSFQLDVSNAGNQDINDITIRDERQNPVNLQPFSLSAGDAITFSYQVVPVMSEPVRSVRFVLDGTDALGGAYHLESAQAYEVSPFIDESQIQVALGTETLTPWSADAGSVSVRVLIRNTSGIPLENAVLSESVLGALTTYASLPYGETVYDAELPLGSPRNLIFTLTAQDPTGTQRSLGETTFLVTTDSAATPEVTQVIAGVEEGDSLFSRLNGTVSRLLLLLGGLMVLGFVVLITLTILERRRAPKDVFADGDEDDPLDAFFNDESPTYRGRYAVRNDDPYRRETDAALRHESRYASDDEPLYGEPRYEKPPELPSVSETAARPVTIEYEDSFEGQRRYAPSRAAGQTETAVGEDGDEAYSPRVHVGGMRAGSHSDEGEPVAAPKVVELSQRPAVRRNYSSNVVRRVRKPDDPQ